MKFLNTVTQGDCLELMAQLPAESVNCCVTSPPYYGLRDYGCDGQIGLEPTPEAYVLRMVEVFREVRRVLRADGTCWINIGDSYAAAARILGRMDETPKDLERRARQYRTGKPKASSGGNYPKTYRVEIGSLKPKDLIGIPWRVALALQADGWYLRSDIIWAKPNPMPESVTDRPTKAHEYIFLLSKSPRYFYDADSIAEPLNDKPHTRIGNASVHHSPGQAKAQYTTRNKRTVWTVTPKPFKGAHFATFAPALIEPCILAGCPTGGVVLDPFAGAGTTGVVARDAGRQFIQFELNPAYCEMARRRLAEQEPVAPLFLPQATSDDEARACA